MEPGQSDRAGLRRFSLDGIPAAERCFLRDLLGGQLALPKAPDRAAPVRVSITRRVRTMGTTRPWRERTLRSRSWKTRRPAADRCDGCRPCFFCLPPHAMAGHVFTCEQESGRYWPSSFGLSVISASLVSSSVATLAAFCSPVRTTLVGSITPESTKSSYLSVAAL